MHREYKRIAQQPKTAVLFIHGIVGTPNHFRPFLPLVPEYYSAYNLLLDGHGKGVRDFSRTSMKKWEKQVEAAVSMLAATHEEIIIAAHSMGTLLAIEQAGKCEKVKALFLLAVPIKIHVRMRNWVITTKIFFGRVRPDDHITLAARDCMGVELSKNPFLYLGWIPRFLELFHKVRQTQKLLPCLRTPCAAYQSMEDELVSVHSAQYLKDHSDMAVYTLKNSTHYYYDPQELKMLTDAFAELMK